ncbi:MAG: hypothetical protein AAFY15_16480, partial [Cyanobacteria bacterium J06648_11]
MWVRMNDPARVRSRRVGSAWLQRVGLTWWQKLRVDLRRLLSVCLIVLWCSWSLSGCGEAPVAESEGLGAIAIADTPLELVKLGAYLDRYEPRVRILSPKPDEVLTGDRAIVKFDVEGYPLFKNPEFSLGPHLHVILDNEPYRALYDASTPMTFEDLAPGTHTIRAFA